MNSPSRSRRPTRLRVVAAALAACASALLLCGCSGSLIADHLPAAAGGLPEDAPERPAAEVAYPAVHNMPPARAAAPLDNDQQKQLADDLVAARNRYGGKPDKPSATGTAASASGTAASASGTAANANGTTANAKAGSDRNP
jgi:hypothetical protein